MSILDILKVITPIFLITLVGYFYRRAKKIELKPIADFIIYISAPALALAQLSMQRMRLTEIASIALSAALVILGTGAISWILFKVLKLKAPTGLYLPIMFMNSGFIGYPLALFALGGIGLSKAIIYDITNAILIFTLGIYLVSKEKSRWQVFKIPFIYAAIIGLVLSLTRVQLPQYIYSPLYLLGGTMIPLALFMLGCHLAQIRIVSWRFPLIATGLRIGLGLGLGLLAVWIFRLQGVTAQVVILASSLSSAITTVALAEEYDASPELVSSTIALSTVASMITIILILNWFG
jgi:hypothetical protein